MAQVRRLATRLVARGADLGQVVQAVEARLGVPVSIKGGRDLDGADARCFLGHDGGQIFVDASVGDDRRDQVVLHELGHMVLGHVRGERRHYDERKERDAELFATVVAQRMRLERLTEEGWAVRW